MLKVGLTGGIGTGKSTIAGFFKNAGIKVFDADEAVHRLYKKDNQGNFELNKIFNNINDLNGDIDRKQLSKLIIENSENLTIIEKIIHPLVQKARLEFIKANENEKLILIDIPLLFETHQEKEFDKIILAHCEPETQKKRVMARQNMTLEKFNNIIAKQIPNKDKIKLADYVINTEIPLESVESTVKNIIKELS